MPKPKLRVIYGDGQDIEEEEPINAHDRKEVEQALERWHPSKGRQDDKEPLA